MSNWLYGEVLKAVFPHLDGKDLVSCMLVCRQWRDIAREDYFWKCICAKRWPSVCRKPPPALSYFNLFATFSKPHRCQTLPPPMLSFDDLVFYIDLWLEERVILSEAVAGPALRLGIKNPPHGIPDVLKTHLDGPDCKLLMQVEPRLTDVLGQSVTVSVLVARKDTNKMACIVNKSLFDYVDSTAGRALAYDYLTFSPRYPFIADIRAWVSLLFLAKGNSVIEVFGIEIDFCDAAQSEMEVFNPGRESEQKLVCLFHLPFIM
ncbi:F-box protein [Ananas comosus]|uniref:F-box protein n=1 Tax=Ananas comosus TaxID=4615 RepID=A0A199VZC8_ANACO|nr:F-box protein [Ananas comosus]